MNDEKVEVDQGAQDLKEVSPLADNVAVKTGNRTLDEETLAQGKLQY